MKKLFTKQLRMNSTDAESILWHHLRNRHFFGLKFRRQVSIGPKFIVDFVCIEKMLIIELDGGQHAIQIQYDNERTKFLNHLGYKVIRVWNNEVFSNLTGVLEFLKSQISQEV